MKTIVKSPVVVFLGIVAVSLSALFLYAENKAPNEPGTECPKECPKECPTECPKDVTKNAAVLAPSSYWIGIQIVPIPDVLLSHFGVKEEGKGRILVEQIVPDGPAAKAGLKRGDVILQFADKEINSLHDLVEKIAEVKETAKPIQIIRDGAKTELSITPAPRPEESLALQNHPLFPGRSIAPNPILPPPGMKLGPEVWIGPRDPQKMIREMEEYFRQLQGGADGDQLLVITNGNAPLPNGNSGKQLSVSSITDKDGKTKIRVKQVISSGGSTEEKSWEAEKIDDLPEEIRGEIQKMLPGN